MSVIDLGAKTEFEVKWSGQVYKLREPTAREMADYQKKSKADTAQDHSLDLLVDFVGTLGMPKDVSEQLPMSRLNALVEGLVGAISKKN